MKYKSKLLHLSSMILLLSGILSLSARAQDTKVLATDPSTQIAWKEWCSIWDKIHNNAGVIYKKLDSVTKNNGDQAPYLKQLKHVDQAIIDSVDIFVKKYPASPVSPWVIDNRFVGYPNPEKAELYYNMLKGPAKNSPNGLALGKSVTVNSKTAVGKNPDFSMADSSGKLFKLSSLRGKVVLVDFWASWCGPCRKENPNLVKAYAAYHAKGFEIVGISLDEKKENWIKAVKTDQLNWIQLSDLKGWKNTLALQYGIKSIPMNFLVDASGKIIAKDLRGGELVKKLQALLGEDTQANAAALQTPGLDSLIQQRGVAVDAIFKGDDPFEKEKRFKEWIAKYPPINFPGIRLPYDYVRSGIGNNFAKTKQFDKAVEYANQIETPFWRGEGLAGIAYSMLKQGDTIKATVLIKQALDSSEPFLNPNPKDNQAMFAATGYPGYATTYSELMYKAGKYEEALKYMKEAEKYSKMKDAAFYLTYANILKVTGKQTERTALLETSVKEGQANQKILAALKSAYIEKNRGDKGYQTYLSMLEKAMTAKINAKLTKEVIDEPAAAFSLKDMNGKTVSLADLKGKVVVLDFWATWCGPCVRSFPAMQKAVNLYKNDSKVQFLFIDTWETAADYEKMVKSFITNNKYQDFSVLFDPKDKTTDKPFAAAAYNVSSIPAKFVIDGNGRIRFRLTGFSGGEDAAVQELSSMIIIAKQKS